MSYLGEPDPICRCGCPITRHADHPWDIGSRNPDKAGCMDCGPDCRAYEEVSPNERALSVRR